MTDYVISDTHFGHANIIKYTNRPFIDLHHMHTELISRWNSVVGLEDIVYILGDFSMGAKSNTPIYAAKLNGRKILILGNHDRKKVCIDTFDSVHKYLSYSPEIFMIHNPAHWEFHKDIPTPKIILCGHVHTLWRTKTLNGITYINVGVDQWDFTPQLISEIINVG